MDADSTQAELQIQVVGDTIAVAGEIDVATAPQLTAAIASVPDGPIVLDLSGVEFIDSSGIGALLTAHQVLTAAGRELRIGPRSPTVAHVLSVSGAEALLAS